MIALSNVHTICSRFGVWLSVHSCTHVHSNRMLHSNTPTCTLYDDCTVIAIQPTKINKILYYIVVARFHRTRARNANAPHRGTTACCADGRG